MDMGNHRYCIVCEKNKENSNNSHLKTLFKFPNSPRRKAKWIRNLNLRETEIKGRSKVCDLHFAKSQFVRNYLKKGAVPHPIFEQPICASTVKPVLVQPQIIPRPLFPLLVFPEITNVQPRGPIPTPPTSFKSDAVRKKTNSVDVLKQLHKIRTIRLLKKQREDRRKIKRLHARVRELKEKLKQRVNIKDAFSENEMFQKLVEAQVKRYTTNKRWYTDFEKTAALSACYSCGSNGYRTLKKMGFALPDTRTLQKWTKDFRIQTGINQQLFNCIKEATSSYTDEEKDCLITWDEMSIKQFVEYNKCADMFEGLQDFGKHGKSLEFANEVLVFMIRGLNSNWRFPISYYFSKHATPSEILDLLVTENVIAAQNIGLKVRLGICDMSFTNQGLYRSWSITKSNPFKIINKSRIFFIHDTPHLMKLIRNNLLKHNFFMNEKVGRTKVIRKIKWSHIRTFYLKDKRTLSRMAPRLSNAHIYLKDFSKMKVKLATQVLSHSVYAGIMTICRLKILKKDFIDTSRFVRKIDEIFDFLNMSLLRNDKWGRCACYFYQNLNETNNYIRFFESISIPTMNNREPDFLKGLVLTLSGIKQLAVQLKKEGYKHLFTRNLQQDCVENYFSLVRSKGGCNRNPTARSFRNNFRALFFATLAHSPQSGNSEFKSEGLAKYVENLNHFVISSSCSPTNSNETTASFVDQQVTPKQAASFYSVKLFRKLKFGKEQENEVAAYIGAASIHAISKRSKCRLCKGMLVSKSQIGRFGEKKFTLIDYKQFDIHSNHLAYLSQEECIFFQKINSGFLESACKTLNESGEKVQQGICNILKIDNVVKNWLNNGCEAHRFSIFEYFVRAKIFRLVKDKNMEIRQLRAWNQTRRDLRNQ